MELATEESRADFVRQAIAEHESIPAFKDGQTAGEFYRRHDRQLEELVKLVYDREGRAHVDEVSPNHKLVSNLYHFFITQLVSYLLGNGVSFDDPEIKAQLGGSDFDYKVQQVLTYAANDGEAYGFVGERGVEPLCFACKTEGKEPIFVPLYDEEDGEVKAGIRYWRLAPDKPMIATLYEIDGYTRYKETKDKTFSADGVKHKYIERITSNDIEGETARDGENYDRFPIVRMGFICGESSIVGNKGKLFAYDLVMSGMVNNVDMNTVYWIIKNAEGMDKRDDLKFVADIIHDKIIHEPDGAEVRKEEISSRHEAFVAVLSVLRQQLFTDFQAVDVTSISGGSKTTVEIKAAYENLNLKCDEVERYVADFIRGCLRVKGLDENASFHFKRPNNINETEYIQTISQISPILGEDTSLKLICEALGIGDEYEDIKEQRDLENMQIAGLGGGYDEAEDSGEDESETYQIVLNLLDELIEELE